MYRVVHNQPGVMSPSILPELSGSLEILPGGLLECQDTATINEWPQHAHWNADRTILPPPDNLKADYLLVSLPGYAWIFYAGSPAKLIRFSGTLIYNNRKGFGIITDTTTYPKIVDWCAERSIPYKEIMREKALQHLWLNNYTKIGVVCIKSEE